MNINCKFGNYHFIICDQKKLVTITVKVTVTSVSLLIKCVLSLNNNDHDLLFDLSDQHIQNLTFISVIFHPFSFK